MDSISRDNSSGMGNIWRWRGDRRRKERHRKWCMRLLEGGDRLERKRPQRISSSSLRWDCYRWQPNHGTSDPSGQVHDRVRNVKRGTGKRIDN